MVMVQRKLVIGLATAIFASLSSSSVLAADKSGFNLFRPTPKADMRELSTDRPDKTESPYTVDAGHFQIETDIVTQSRDKQSGATTSSTLYLYSNLKLGLTNGSDLQVIVSPQQVESSEVSGVKEEKSGVSDTIVRWKLNLLGNDGGDIAIGVMPFVKLPSAAQGLGGNKKIEGGIIIPFTLNLPRDWSLGLMAQFNRDKNESSNAFHTVYINTFTIGHDIWGDLAGYMEFYSESSDERDAPWVATFDVGLTYAVAPDIQLDMGANVGVTQAAEDLNPFVGISARI